MLPYWTERFGNASSVHAAGREAKAALSAARDNIAAAIGCPPAQLVFTGSGTESDNMALLGAAEAYSSRGKHIITSQVEHHAVLHACERLAHLGYEVTFLPVDRYGQVSLSDMENAVRPDTILISLMHGNNEVGTVQPIEAIGRMARERGICFHVDAVQSLGHAPIDLRALPVDLMSFSAHKVGGPKGIGALYIAGNIRMSPLMFGGSQERKRRPGTENTAGIAGFAEAVQHFAKGMYDLQQNLEKLRLEMVQGLYDRLGQDGFVVNGHPTERLPHILNVSFPGISTETMLMNLDLAGIAAASGSACTSGSLELSHVLQAMRLQEDLAASAIRFSFGWTNNKDQVREAVQRIETIVSRLRNNK